MMKRLTQRPKSTEGQMPHDQVLGNTHRRGAQAGAIALALTAASLSLPASAFVDERTPPPPPVMHPAPLVTHETPIASKATVPPAHVAPLLPAAPAMPASAARPSATPAKVTTLASSATRPASSSAPALAAKSSGAQPTLGSSSLKSDVHGELSAPAWHEPYPGPFGQMTIASALIAQAVPVVGGSVQFAGPIDLLSRTTYVGQGPDRLVVLQNSVKTANVAVTIKGHVLTLSSTGEPPKAQVSAPMAAAPTASTAAKPGTKILPGITIPPAKTASVSDLVRNAQPVALRKTWNLSSGSMLSSEMSAWAKQWGWNLVWNAEMDYRIATPVTINDTFLGGVQQILNAYRHSDRPLWGDFNDKQKVLVISEPATNLTEQK